MSWGEELKKQLPQEVTEEALPGLRVVSAVLAPIAWDAEKRSNQIILMKRTTTVAFHKGQISFPGGVREAVDRSPLETALRETEEEIGVRRGDIEVLGALRPVKTRNDVLIYPWVGKLSLPYDFRLNQAEVDALIYLPLERLVVEGLETVHVPVGDYKVESIGIDVDRELVWGATARMLQELREFCLKLPISEPV